MFPSPLTLPTYPPVILATNMAESSLTIPSVTHVVDCCLVRLPFSDPAGAGVSFLVTLPVSVQGARQRAGRAGRTQVCVGSCVCACWCVGLFGVFFCWSEWVVMSALHLLFSSSTPHVFSLLPSPHAPGRQGVSSVHAGLVPSPAALPRCRGTLIYLYIYISIYL